MPVNTRPALRLLWGAGLLGLLAGCGHHQAPPPVVDTLERERIELVADAAEPVVQILVHEGETVQAGQPLLRLDPARLQARLDQAVATREEAAARLAELTRGPREEEIAAARARLRGADEVLQVRQRELARQERLLARGLASPEDRDAARVLRDGALAERDTARARLDELLKGTRAEQLEQARQALARAEAAVVGLRRDLARLTVTAPVSGQVDEILFRVGEQPRAGEVVAVMYDAAHTYARVYVPEALRVAVRPGTRAEVSIDGLDSPLRGRLRWVSAEPSFTPYYALTERDRGRLSYLAKIDLEGAGELPVGLPLEARLDLPAQGGEAQ